MQYKVDTKRLSEDIIEDILLKRGVKKEDIKNYLKPSLKLLPKVETLGEDKLKLFNDLLLKHNQDKIMVIVDSDCDGFCSSAIFANFFKHFLPIEVFNSIEFYIHEAKTHGLPDCIDYIVENDFKFIIIPDAGSNDIQQLQVLKDNNIDFMVIDHHLIENEKENPFLDNIISCKLDGYTNPYLTGSGLSFRVCEYLSQLWGEPDYYLQLMDLAAVGIVADMQELVNTENRAIVNLGLSNLCNKFLIHFIEKNSFFIKDVPTPNDISFSVAPYFNSMARTGKLEEQKTFFKYLINDFYDSEAIKLVERVKSRQTRGQSKATEFVISKIENEHLADNRIIIVDVTENDFPKALKGLVANMVANDYKKPCLIVNSTDEMLEGSGRGYEKSDIVNFKSELVNSGLVKYALGHENAFGIGFNKNNLNKLNNYFNTKYDKPIEYLQPADYVMDFSTNRQKKELKNIYNHRNLWGKGVQEPLIVSFDIPLNKDNTFIYEKKNTSTIKIIHNDIYYLIFKSKTNQTQDIKKSLNKKNINIIGTCHVNSWEGDEQLQIFVKEYELFGKTEMFDCF